MHTDEIEKEKRRVRNERIVLFILPFVLTAIGISMLINPDPEFFVEGFKKERRPGRHGGGLAMMVAIWLLWSRPVGVLLLIFSFGGWIFKLFAWLFKNRLPTNLLQWFLKTFFPGLVLEPPNFSRDKDELSSKD
jgi:hypothetical protein